MYLQYEHVSRNAELVSRSSTPEIDNEEAQDSGEATEQPTTHSSDNVVAEGQSIEHSQTIALEPAESNVERGVISNDAITMAKTPTTDSMELLGQQVERNTSGTELSTEETRPPLAIMTGSTEPDGVDNGEITVNETTDGEASPSALEQHSKTEAEEPVDDMADVASTADSDIFENDSPSGFATRTESQYLFPRYEISQALYHLQMLEDEWPLEESKSQGYEDLYKDVLKFFDPDSIAFQVWKVYEVNRPGAPLERQQAENQLTALHFAAASGLVELSRRLIDDKQADVNGKAPDGTTPLCWSCRVPDNVRKYNICKLLLEKGALPGLDALRLPNGGLVSQETPFNSLMYTGATEARLVRLFLDHGVKVNEVDPWGYNVMHNFAWSGMWFHTRSLLKCANSL
jgi:ankyrin repeat protein